MQIGDTKFSLKNFLGYLTSCKSFNLPQLGKAAAAAQQSRRRVKTYADGKKKKKRHFNSLPASQKAASGMIGQLSGPITYDKALQGMFFFIGILILLTGSETFVPLLTGRERRKLCPGYLPLCMQNGDHSALPRKAYIILTP